MKFRFPVALAAIAPLEAHDAPVVEHAAPIIAHVPVPTVISFHASSPHLLTTTVNAPEYSPRLFILLKIENHASDIQNMEKSI